MVSEHGFASIMANGTERQSEKGDGVAECFSASSELRERERATLISRIYRPMS